MNNCLFKDTPTAHRIRSGNKTKVVYARHDHEGRFVRFVVQKTKAEVKKEQAQYLPLIVGVCEWYETYPHFFIDAN